MFRKSRQRPRQSRSQLLNSDSLGPLLEVRSSLPAMSFCRAVASHQQQNRGDVVRCRTDFAVKCCTVFYMFSWGLACTCPGHLFFFHSGFYS